MKNTISFTKIIILAFILLSTFFCIAITNQHRMVILAISLMGFVFSFLSYSKYLIMNKQEDLFVILNSYFDGAFTEKVRSFSLSKYKNCTVSQRNVNINKDTNFTDEPTQYGNEYYLKIFTENGILEPFSGNSSKEKIKMLADKINKFFKYQDNSLTLKEDYKKVLRYIGYGLILLSNFIGYAKIFLTIL